MAETEGFEPSVRVNPVRRFSKPLVSATHPRLQRRQTGGLRPHAELRAQLEAITPADLAAAARAFAAGTIIRVDVAAR